MKKIALVLFVLMALVFNGKANAAERIVLVDGDGVELGTLTNPLPVTGISGGGSSGFQALTDSGTSVLLSNTYQGTSISGDLTVDTNTLVVDSANNRVGIGVATPNNNLEVGSNGQSVISINSANNSDTILVFKESDSSKWIIKNEIDNDSFIVRSLETTGDRFIIAQNGNVGIGSDQSPDYLLDVQGDANIDGSLTATDAYLTTINALNAESLSFNADTEIIGDLTVGGTNARQSINSGATGDGIIEFEQNTTRRAFVQHLDSADELKIASEYGKMALYTASDGNEGERVTITPGGNVGIAQANPIVALDVNGDARISGNLSITSLDVIGGNTFTIGGDAQINGDLTVTGDTMSGVQTLSVSGNTTLTARNMQGAVVYVDATCTVTMPAVADGYNVTIIALGAVTVTVEVNASDKIWLDGTALDDGDTIDSTGTSGDVAVITYYSADGWFASTNTWVDGGAT